jgi:uncharacterized cupin superfamily protein
MFFLERKNQRTFPNEGEAAATARLQWTKVFLLLFLQKKKTLVLPPPHPPDQHGATAAVPAISGASPKERTPAMAKKIDIAAAQKFVGTLYPPPFDEPCLKRERTKLGDAAGLTQYGVNLLRLPPGVWSSQRHWQSLEDEFVYVLSGEVTLVTNAGAEILRPGDCAGFKAGDTDGHCLQNRSNADATVLEIGTRIPGEAATYSDIDMKTQPGVGYVRKDGTPYPKAPRRAG